MHTYVHILSTGGILAGLVSDILQARAFTSTASLYLAIPAVSIECIYANFHKGSMYMQSEFHNFLNSGP